MATYDVTVTLRPGMPTWDGEPGPACQPIKRIGVDGETAQVSLLTLGTHTGTHVDAPAHYIPNGLTADKLPLDALVGSCRVVEVVSDSMIEAADLEDAAQGARRLLVKTPSGAFWEHQEFRRDFVALSQEAASWLVAQDVLLVGIDYLSVDPFDSDAAHVTLLGAGVVVLEGLDLREVPPGEYDLSALPLKIAEADGAPARVILRSHTDGHLRRHGS